MNLLKRWFNKYILSAFKKPKTVSFDRVKTTSHINSKRIQVISFGALNVRLRKPYR